MTHADWGWPSWSPNSYHTFEVTFALIGRLRAKKWYTPEPGAACDPGPSLASANAVFRRLGDSRSLAVRRPHKGVRRPHGGKGLLDPSAHLESVHSAVWCFCWRILVLCPCSWVPCMAQLQQAAS